MIDYNSIGLKKCKGTKIENLYNFFMLLKKMIHSVRITILKFYLTISTKRDI